MSGIEVVIIGSAILSGGAGVLGIYNAAKVFLRAKKQNFKDALMKEENAKLKNNIEKLCEAMGIRSENGEPQNNDDEMTTIHHSRTSSQINEPIDVGFSPSERSDNSSNVTVRQFKYNKRTGTVYVPDNIGNNPSDFEA